MAATQTREQRVDDVRADRLAIGLGAAAFLGLGLRDGLLGVAWPSVQQAFGLPVDALGLLLVAGTAGYVLATGSSGRLAHAWPILALLSVATGILGLALLGGGLAPRWWLLVACTALAGMGGGLLDAGLNAYLALHGNARIVSLTHASWGIGSLASPVVVTTILAAGWSWRWGYGFAASGGLCVAACCGLLLLRQQHRPRPANPISEAEGPGAGWRETVLQPLVWANIALFTLYIGVEATAGTWLYTVLTEGRGVGPTTAGVWVSGFWASLIMGRLLFSAVATPERVRALLWLSLLGAVAGSVLIWLQGALWVSLAGMLLLGLALAPIFPVLVAETSERVGAEHTANAMGFQFAAAAIGGSLIPTGAGVLAARWGLESVPALQLGVALGLLAAHALVERWRLAFRRWT